MVARKFKKSLPNTNAFIFEDPKDADEFYNYINTKYELGHQNVEGNVPVIIDNKEFFLSFYETEIPTKTLNLVPILVDASLDSKGNDPMFEDAHVSRIGNWYLALTVSDTAMNDCLSPSYKDRDSIVKYLRDLRKEYLNTQNYLEALFKK